MQRIRMATLVVGCVPFVLAGTAAAHPGHGIAVDRTGEVVFTDIAQRTIWRCSTQGNLRVAVPSTWTHSLRLHDDGTLYFERELEVEGVAPAELNKIDPSGHRENVIRAELDRARFGGSGFMVLDDGSVLFPYSDRGDDGKYRAFIGKRAPDGGLEVFAGSKQGPLYTDGPKDRATFRMITDLARGRDGTIYVLDRDRLRAISKDGTTRTIAKQLLDEPPSDPPQKTGPATTINRLYGLALGETGEFYVAYHSGRKVLKVLADGTHKTVYEADRPWAPVGVAYRDGKCFVLETQDDLRNVGPRVRILEQGKPVRTLVTVDPSKTSD